MQQAFTSFVDQAFSLSELICVIEFQTLTMYHCQFRSCGDGSVFSDPDPGREKSRILIRIQLLVI